MQLPSYFADFLADIRLTPNQVMDLRTGHTTLRERLLADSALAPIIVTTFLQGSYRRATAVRPKDGKRSDVDVIVVTRLSQDEYSDPEKAMQVFIPFMDKYYEGKYRLQGRSIGVELSYVDLDLVITTAPSESEEGILKADSVSAEDTPEDTDDWRLVKSWVSVSRRSLPKAQFSPRAAGQEDEWRLSPLSIPNREAQCWEATHPLEQIRWTWEKNRRCNAHYVNVVKAIKWWRRVNHPTPKYPKGYPIEHLVGQCCPDNISSVAEGVTRTLEIITQQYQTHASLHQTPSLPDHGVPDHNVFERVSGDDFASFHAQVRDAAVIARKAYDDDAVSTSAKEWQNLFGDKFPEPPTSGGTSGPNKGGYTQRTERSQIGGGRFA